MRPVFQFQHTAARRRLDGEIINRLLARIVSTHSRPKAAGSCHCRSRRTNGKFQHTAARRRLVYAGEDLPEAEKFQHTAARRRLACLSIRPGICVIVSTHSRPKAAGGASTTDDTDEFSVSTHSRPKAAGTIAEYMGKSRAVSTHSRPKAAGYRKRQSGHR